MARNPPAQTQGGPREDLLRRFFHDLAGPLSAVALRLEAAARAVQGTADPLPALAAARRELEEAFGVFERGRASLLSEPGAPAETPRP